MSILFASNIASPPKKRNCSLSTIFSFAIDPVKPVTQVARVSVGVIPLDIEGGQRIHWRRRRPTKSDIWQTNSASRYNAGRTLDISTGAALKRDQTTLPSSVSTRVPHWVKVSPNFLPNFIELGLLLLLSVTPIVPLWLKRQSQEVL